MMDESICNLQCAGLVNLSTSFLCSEVAAHPRHCCRLRDGWLSFLESVT